MYFIYGLQKSGTSLVKLLEKNKQDYRIWDDDQKVRNDLKKIYDVKYFCKPTSKNLSKFKKIIVSPGISLRQKKFQDLKKYSKLNRDLNIYFSNLNYQKVIAITGTNGKSTTTKLIGDILKKSNNQTFVGGNIGEPLCNSLLSRKKFNFHVIELSSFQLETASNLNTKISIITNLSNDHLDRYININDYINQKKKIINKKGINLISIDDIHSKKIFSKKNLTNKISFSISDSSADVYVNGNFIIDNYFKKNKILNIAKISKDLEGDYNKQNIVIAYICCKVLNIPNKYFINSIKNFKGLPYRSNIIYRDNNLKIINNSKSTNINSAINSVRNYNNIYLILGGIAKENNFEILSNFKNKIICIYAFGKSAKLIERKLNKLMYIKVFKNLNLTVSQIFKDIKKNNFKSNIIFAPACTSYDQYKNFEERGEDFNYLINKKIKKL